ncbi:MAG: T9SS type A sorting domain-containing protein [Bacteroidota bacterium]
MKKIYTLFCLMGIFLSQTNAQITITRSDFGMIGDIVYYATDTTLNNLSVGASGTNKTWNFNSSVSPNTYDTATFKDPNTVLGAPAEANLAIDEGMLGASFFHIDSNRVKTVLPLSDYGMDNQLLSITNFPLQYGDVVKDSSFNKVQGTPADFGFSGLPYDSIRITVDVKTTSTADGWGSLIVPSGTHNVLRVRNVTNVDVTVEGKIAIFWTTVPVNLDRNQILFAWYAKNKKYAMAEAQLDTNGVVTTFRYQVDSVPTKPTTGLANLTPTSQLTAYPNPANETITFNTTSPTGQLSIMDATGQLVSRKTFDTQNILFDTQLLPAGFYMAHIQDTDGSHSSIKFVVQH